MEQKPPMSAPLLGRMVSWYYSRPINTLAPISSFFFDKPLLQSLDNIKIPPPHQANILCEGEIFKLSFCNTFSSRVVIHGFLCVVDPKS